ncbi:hypothetical protein HanRHA438_Chr11g0502201 [Helianthus annuus]|uniref:Uncharacterized protein n=1 Tax=Helianthus annuus TaxID=4232 RepID=A0A251SD17_HELAN|nr:hypothetical protein HanXRQr2_Chr11g0489401 [Helianthus annuus]KAJ0509261.1 hypothetical protein HanIR_Chr11g0526851 [Helianthus annuus]KAJ0870592.1 hypothetical protein HanRHA438_Chr11g0502201 [Helianthus annuus]KAJ0875057.1 hypothetical protein HanPSC8_Chr11g0471701 [Helianthus annuus]
MSYRKNSPEKSAQPPPSPHPLLFDVKPPPGPDRRGTRRGIVSFIERVALFRSSPEVVGVESLEARR